MKPSVTYLLVLLQHYSLFTQISPTKKKSYFVVYKLEYSLLISLHRAVMHFTVTEMVK